MFNQVNGLTPVTEERLKKLYRVAIKSIRTFEKISLEWISPEQNRPALSAVKRCMKDALGREKKASSLSSQSPLRYPAMLSLIEKGEQATEEDYGKLTEEEDEWTHKSLSELRTLIPLEIRDLIALQWQGDENNLAQMYRWHLRGLPPTMACRKVNLDQKSEQATKTKLPWEEALNLPQPLLGDSNQTADPLMSLLSELRTLIPLEIRDLIALQWQGDENNLAQMYRWHLRGLPPTMACRKVNLDQKSEQATKTKLPWEEALNLPQPLLGDSNQTADPLMSLLSELDISEAEVEEDSLGFRQSESEEPILFETLIIEDLQGEESVLYETDFSSSTTHLAFNEESHLSFDKENMDLEADGLKDGLTSESSVIDILKVIESLSPEEQTTLAQELVKIPDMVNLILKAIAENVSRGHGEPE